MGENIMKKIIIFWFSLVFLSSCAAFRTDISGTYTDSVNQDIDKEKVSAMFVFYHYRQTTGFDAIPKLNNYRQIIEGFDDFFQDAMKEFSNVSTYNAYTEFSSDVHKPERRAKRDSLISKSDYVLSVKILKQNSFSKKVFGIITSTASLTLLPVPYSKTYYAEVEVFNSEKKCLGKYKREAKLTKWIQPLLIFAYPFHPEKRKIEEIYVEMLHDIFRQIEEENILQ